MLRHVLHRVRSHSKPSRIVWIGAAVMAVLGLLAFVGVPGAQTPPAPAGAVSVAIQQLDWVDGNGQVSAANSTTGVARFTFASSAAGLAVGSDGAYLNLYTSIDGGATYQLAVENLWVQFNTSADLLASRLAALIDLGNTAGTAVASVRYQVSLTHDPVEPLTRSAAMAAKSAFMTTDFTVKQPLYTDFPPPTTDYPPPTTTDFPTTDYAEIPDPDDVTFDTSVDSYDDLATDFEDPAPAPTYTVTPLPTFPVYVAPPIQHVGIALGGFGGGGVVGFGNPPRPVPFRPVWRPAIPPAQPAPPPRPGVRPRPLGGVLGPIPGIVESPMSCAPSAVARSIQYMLNMRGRGGPGAQAIMGNLYNLMGTSAVNGTSLQGMLNGKQAYNNANRLGIQTVAGANAGQAAATLNNGGDVELNIVWPNSGRRGCPGGGHVAMVTSISLLPNGNFQVTYVDDQNQHDGNSSSTPGQANDTHTLIVRPNGAIVSGFPCPGGVVAGLVAENMP